MDRRRVVERVQQHLASIGIAAASIEETSAFGDIGLTSLDVMTLLLEVQREYGLSGNWIANTRFPNTVGEFADLIESVSGSSAESTH